MSVDLDAMCRKTLGIEGGFVNDPNDPGGPTNRGVSLVFARSLPKVNGRSPMDLNGDGRVDIEDIKLITPAIAKKLFLGNFYYAAGVDKLPACIQPMHFDMNVNGGNGGGGRVLQLALMNQHCLIHVDGEVGAATIKAANDLCDRIGETAFKAAYVAARISYYERIVARNPEEGKFLKGWTTRAKSFA